MRETIARVFAVHLGKYQVGVFQDSREGDQIRSTVRRIKGAANQQDGRRLKTRQLVELHKRRLEMWLMGRRGSRDDDGRCFPRQARFKEFLTQAAEILPRH